MAGIDLRLAGGLGVCLLLGLLPAGRAFGQERSAADQAIVDKFEAVLPDCERAAADYKQLVEPFLESGDRRVGIAVEALLMRVWAIERVRPLLESKPSYFQHKMGPSRVVEWKDSLPYFFECVQKAKDPYEGAVEATRSVRSKLDGYRLVYRIRLPPDYSPERKWPLEIGLPCAGCEPVPSLPRGVPSYQPGRAENRAAITVSAPARGSGHWSAAMGAPALLEILEDIKLHYAVDEDRIVIGGASAGGTGGFRFGAFYPELFAAVYSLTSRPTLIGYNELKQRIRGKPTPPVFGLHDPTMLMENYANGSILIWDAPNDQGGPEGFYRHNRNFVEDIKKRAEAHPGYYAHLELTDPKGTHGGIAKPLQQEGWKWMHARKRNPFPKKVIYKTYGLRYDGAFWARIDTVEQPDAPARIEAEWTDDRGMIVAVTNVARFHLDLDERLTGRRADVDVAINGARAVRAPNGGTVFFTGVEGAWDVSPDRYPKGLIKKHGISGPIHDIFMGTDAPVMLVDRLPGGAETNSQTIAAVIDRFLSGGQPSFAYEPFPRKRGDELTDQDIAEKHLIVYGTPADNPFLQRIADRLPVRFEADGGFVFGEIKYRADQGIMLIYPNPLNLARYVLLISRPYADWGFWTRPDYVVFNKASDGRTRSAREGFFDARWQLPQSAPAAAARNEN